MHHFRWSLITIPLVSFLLSLGLQGTFAAVGPTAETFVSGITKSIHQLTLGIVDLRPSEPTSLLDPVESADLSAFLTDAEESIFDGYVPESTNIRLRLNQVALWTWLSAPGREGIFPIDLDCHISIDNVCDDSVTLPDNAGCAVKTVKLRTCNTSTRLTPSSIFFGVGLGGAGTAMHAAYPDVVTSPKEIVQNQPFSLLLETGLIGLILAIFGLCVALFPHIFPAKFLDGRASTTSNTIKPKPATSKSTPAGTPDASVTPAIPSLSLWRHPVLPLLLPLIVAYFITLNFFSGLPNALQIYLMPPLLYLIFLDRPTSPPSARICLSVSTSLESHNT